MQMGSSETFDVNLVASTVNEIHHLVPLLQEFQAQHRRVNVLYGIPLVPSQVPRLASLARTLGEDTIAVMIDHPAQIDFLSEFHRLAGLPASVFIKVDTGYHRAGLPPTGLNKADLLKRLAQAERDGHARLLGVYSHSSLSYAGSTPEEAMGHLTAEITGCRDAVRHHVDLLPDRELVISVGATPQAASVQNLLQGQTSAAASAEARGLRELLRDPLPGARVKVELHAGNYAVLDMQQLETQAESRGRPDDEVAISVVAEVCSLYNGGERAQPEALLAAGTLALGREPCHSYPGWGVIGQWRREAASRRLILARISQEHSIVTWEKGRDGDEVPDIPLEVGQAVRVYPNHSCVTGAMHGWYLVVDSDLEEGSKVVDVWVRARGYSALPA
ncbi:hypothetical protein P170DRAFT_438118 [Aspergillus steynii IBT 23096]|uniref:D-serine dehydratase-like domain-containing protein n=1 Tax=Aspergillus steynii IBT 23096 TaxID=1392250 RepID=A0A2I2G6N8_9EURO|nr:uncharacterized protein P170DRAFT_438118 [Aspergillus steynii IBT 23096]PLB48536.1 hypothetical protein P170DRAFT_438118 [Aspergillus steynii IBT 23096]